MSIIDAPLVLPKIALLAVWEWHAGELGDPHPILGTNGVYYMPEGSSERIETRTWELLTRARLARNQRVSPLLIDTLRVLGSADREFYGWTAYPTALKRDGGGFFTGARGRDALRVLVDDDAVILQPLPDHRALAADLVHVLPRADAAPVRAVSIPRETPARPPVAAGGRSPLAHPDTPPSDPDRDLITDVMTAPREATHQLYTAVQGRGGRVRSLPLTAVDVADYGRAVTFTNHDLDGTEYINLTSGEELVRLLEATNANL
ncbi:ESX secretion-associated protein EspG [Amycolatopsis sp. cg5]|uniref:ESX secretion-associated protein EspG n=1 Tax=Amycolatopsis sp. cg5 TaxID=3238802 RepID=UPI003525FBA4